MSSTIKTSWEFELKKHDDFKKIEHQLRNLYSTERGQPCHNLLSSEFINWKRQVFVHLHNLQKIQDMKLSALQNPLRMQNESALHAYEAACTVETQFNNSKKVDVLTCYLPGFHVTFVPQMHLVEMHNSSRFYEHGNCQFA